MTLVIGIIVTLLLSAFFSGIEIAFISSNKLKIELSRKQGHLSGRILSAFVSHPHRFIGATLIGNNIALIILGNFMARLLEPFLKNFWVINNSEVLLLISQTLITTLVVLFFGEFLPKAFFRLYPDRTLHVFSIPMQVFYLVLQPVVGFFTILSRFFLRRVAWADIEENKQVFSKVDLEHYIQQFYPEDEVKDELNHGIFEKALDLVNIRVRECMVPRNEIQAIEIGEGIAALKQEFIRSKHSRILVYKDSVDTVIGYAHHFDLFSNPQNLEELVHPILFVPETMIANDLLEKFIREKKNIACVVDEFGGTAGLVTLEDLLEEIFGEIEDEHDEAEFIENQLSENEFIFSGRMEIDYINETFKLDIPSEEYETLSGLIVGTNESIPAMGDVITIAHYRFIILSVAETRIETVKVIVDQNR